MTVSQLGRTIAVTWPDIGDASPGWVATIQNSVTELSNNASVRYVETTGVNDSTDTEITHNFGIAKDYLKIVFFSGTGATKSIIQDPIGAGWTISVGTNPLTQVKVGTPSSGQPHDFTVLVMDGEVYRETVEQLTSVVPGTPPPNTVVKWRDANGVGLYKTNSGYVGTLESLPVKHVSSAFNADPGFHYVVDTSGGPVTGTLSATIQDYYQVQFSDGQKSFNVNNLTIARNGNSVDGEASDLVLNTAGDGALLVGDNANSNWVKASAGGTGGAGEGGTNYFTNGSFESDVVTGVTVSGGTAATVSAETTSPLQGIQSCLITQGVGTAADVRFEIDVTDSWPEEGAIVPLVEALVKADASDSDGDVTFGIYNETDATWLYGPVDITGGGELNIIRASAASALVDGKTYVGRILRTDSTDTREVLVDRLRLDPINGNAVIPEASNGNLGLVTYERDTGALNSQFFTGTATYTKVAGLVTVSLDTYTHNSQTTPSTSAGFVPERFRPSTDRSITGGFDNSNVRMMTISSSGLISIEYRDWAGVLIARTGPFNGFSITYEV